MKSISVDNWNFEVVKACTDMEVIVSVGILAPAVDVALAHHCFNLKN
jgi:hypothetical protein